MHLGSGPHATHMLRQRPPKSEVRLLTREPPPFQLSYGQPNSTDLLYSFGFYDPSAGNSPNGTFGLARSGSLQRLPQLPDVPTPKTPTPTPWMNELIQQSMMIGKQQPGNAYGNPQQKQATRHGPTRRRTAAPTATPRYRSSPRLEQAQDQEIEKALRRDVKKNRTK